MKTNSMDWTVKPSHRCITKIYLIGFLVHDFTIKRNSESEKFYIQLQNWFTDFFLKKIKTEWLNKTHEHICRGAGTIFCWWDSAASCHHRLGGPPHTAAWLCFHRECLTLQSTELEAVLEVARSPRLKHSEITLQTFVETSFSSIWNHQILHFRSKWFSSPTKLLYYNIYVLVFRSYNITVHCFC